jgi:hypothetical protein
VMIALAVDVTAGTVGAYFGSPEDTLHYLHSRKCCGLMVGYSSGDKPRTFAAFLDS